MASIIKSGLEESLLTKIFSFILLGQLASYQENNSVFASGKS